MYYWNAEQLQPAELICVPWVYHKNEFHKKYIHKKRRWNKKKKEKKNKIIILQSCLWYKVILQSSKVLYLYTNDTYLLSLGYFISQVFSELKQKSSAIEKGTDVFISSAKFKF